MEENAACKQRFNSIPLIFADRIGGGRRGINWERPVISTRLIESACRVAITHDRSFVRLPSGLIVKFFSFFTDEIVKGD